ncbi:AraC family transcriptional regulator [Brevibacterium luteolum]|uniref:AraC family transcriptional regulator n=1 Tax=Brevibacterium luteolum TaxID=199591 RepID=A0A849ART2_9MICO|nr:AraC family transcriptional regulator [Brevibacterium luteolum]MBM7530267.1 AraC-like DNA-binding protein [Brevibacterium luteolum]NNG79908.1 AraC family transcriptional regulator [Brevibacterium luteolum]
MDARDRKAIDLRGHLTPQPVELLRCPAPEAVADRVRWAWVPRWSLPDGQSVTQQVIEFPGGNLVVEPHETRFHPPAPAMSKKDLTGAGWAVGLLLQPACGALLRSTAAWAEGADLDGHVPHPRAELSGRAELQAVSRRIRAQMAATADDHTAEAAACLLLDWADCHLPAPDADGQLLNAIVDKVETDPEILTSSQLAAAAGIGQRRLQRLVSRALGYSPTWLIRRRRLQDAAARIRSGESAAELAAALGYADQPHFQRDFTTVTGQTPGAYRRLVSGSNRLGHGG